LKAQHRLQQGNSVVKAELLACLSNEGPSVGGQRFVGNKTAGVVEMHSCCVVLIMWSYTHSWGLKDI